MINQNVATNAPQVSVLKLLIVHSSSRRQGISSKNAIQRCSSAAAGVMPSLNERDQQSASGIFSRRRRCASLFPSWMNVVGFYSYHPSSGHANKMFIEKHFQWKKKKKEKKKVFRNNRVRFNLSYIFFFSYKVGL